MSRILTIGTISAQRSIGVTFLISAGCVIRILMVGLRRILLRVGIGIFMFNESRFTIEVEGERFHDTINLTHDEVTGTQNASGDDPNLGRKEMIAKDLPTDVQFLLFALLLQIVAVRFGRSGNVRHDGQRTREKSIPKENKLVKTFRLGACDECEAKHVRVSREYVVFVAFRWEESQSK